MICQLVIGRSAIPTLLAPAEEGGAQQKETGELPSEIKRDLNFKRADFFAAETAKNLKE
jgi:hypothetical protein